VLARARAILATLEGQGHKATLTKGSAVASDQLSLFAPPDGASPAEREVLATLRALDVDRMTGLEALQLVARLQGKL